MNINEKFLTETGAISFYASFSPVNTTGSWEFSIGTSGLADKAILFSGQSGRVYDEDGHFLCSYGNRDVVLQGFLNTGHYVTNADRVLAKCATKNRRSVNYINFTSSGEEIPEIIVSGLGSRLEDKSALFITVNQNTDSAWINQINHLFDDVTVTSGYTGTDISGLSSNINDNFDYIFFGQSLGTGNISMSGDWTGVTCAKISLSPSAFPSFGMASNSSQRTGQLYPTIIDTSLDYNLFGETVLGATGFVSGVFPTGEVLVAYSGGTGDAPMFSKYSYNHYLVNIPSGYNNLTDEGRQLFLNFVIDIG